MAMLPFAFSVHNFISSVGADAGFAAIIGLAVLILLYFAHARETANLRQEAALLTQRLQQAEARVLQLSRLQPAVAPAPQAAEPAPAPALFAPFAPVGMAAPALASATRVVPVPLPPVDQDPAEVTPEPVAAPAAAMAMAGVAASVAPAPAAPAPAPATPAPQPATSAPQPAPGVPAPATSAGGNGASRQPVAPPAGGLVASRGTPVARRLPPVGPLPPLKPEPRRSRVGRGVAVALVALAAVAVAVLIYALTSVGSSKPASATSTSNAPIAGHSAGGFNPSSVTVAVLNGTATNQLAHRVGDKLAALGYKRGTIATAANQTATTTVVAYVGSSTRRTRAAGRLDALHVARALGLRPTAVRPVDQSTLQVACPASAACTANVVVTVGADLANP
jgi:LytR cell envelope-related transcriptional attenuator